MIGIEFVVLGGLLLRFVLADQSFWLDEGASLVISRQPLGLLLSSLKADFHPPLFYLMMNFLVGLGIRSEILLRLPNILFGTATIVALYRLVLTIDKKHGQIAGLLAAIFLAVNPLHIYYSQELRMYALSALLTVLSWLFLIKRDKRSWVFFCLATTLNLYTFYGGFLNLAAQLVFLIWQDRSTLRKNWFWLVLPLILFLPWLPTLMAQLGGGKFLQTALPGWKELSGILSPKALALIPIKFVLGRINLADSLAIKVTGGLATLYFLILMFLGRKSAGSKPLMLWIGIPLLLAVVLSIWSPMLGYWRYIFLLPAAVALAALGIARLKPPFRQLNTGILVIIFMAANLVFWLNPGYQRENWRGVVELDSHFNRLTTLYVFAFSDAFAPFRWYLPQAQYVAPLRELRSDPNELDTHLSQAVESKGTVLYFEYLAAVTDPQQNIRRWFENAGYKLTKTHNLNGVGFIHEYHPQLIY